MNNIKRFAIIIGFLLFAFSLICLYVYTVMLYRKTFVSGWLIFLFGLAILGLTLLVGQKIYNPITKWLTIIYIPFVIVTALLYANYNLADGAPHNELIYIERKGIKTSKRSGSLGVAIHRNKLYKVLDFGEGQKQLMDSATMVELEVYTGRLGFDCIRTQTLVTSSEVM